LQLNFQSRSDVPQPTTKHNIYLQNAHAILQQSRQENNTRWYWQITQCDLLQTL